MAHKSKAVLCAKRLIDVIRSDAAKGSTSHSPLPVAFTPLRKVHTRTYDKNVEEAVVQPTVVPEHVIGEQPDTYWGPNPDTGVFGPAGRTALRNAKPGGGAKKNNKAAANNINNGPSVLDQEAWFRPVEGVDRDRDIDIDIDIDKPAPPSPKLF